VWWCEVCREREDSRRQAGRQVAGRQVPGRQASGAGRQGAQVAEGDGHAAVAAIESRQAGSRCIAVRVQCA